jgi:Fe-S-cluster containining protein
VKRERPPLPEDRPVALRPGLWGGRHHRDETEGYLLYDPVTQQQEFIKGDLAHALWKIGAGRKPENLTPQLLVATRELWRRGWLALATKEAESPEEAPTAPLTFHARADASFSCGSCGLCCRALHDIGPIQEQERSNIINAAKLIERTKARSAAEILQLSPPADPSEYWPYQLATQKGRCLFLTKESRCSIHAEVGAEQKPMVCQTFPLQLSMIHGQARVIASSRCPSVTLTQGAPLDTEAAAHLWKNGTPLVQPKEPACGWEAYTEAERELLASLEESPKEGSQREARQQMFGAFLARLGYSLSEPAPVGKLYAAAKRLESESRQKGGAPLAAAAWGIRWRLGQRAKSPNRPWEDAIRHSKATRTHGESLRRYLADQIFSGEILQYDNLAEGAWRLLTRGQLIEGHARSLVQAGLNKEPYATAESIYLWDFATMSEAWQFLSPGKVSDSTQE